MELENEFTSNSVISFFHKLQFLDSSRIIQVFTEKTAEPHSTIPKAKESSNSALTIALYEVLTHRRLWSDFRIIRVISRWLKHVDGSMKYGINLDLISQCPGLLQWLIVSDAEVK